MTRACSIDRRSRIAALAALLGVLVSVLVPAGPALAQAGGGAPTAYLFCYTGSGAITSPTSFAPCSGSNPLAVTGGGGGGGAATIANGADVAEGSITDAPATTPTTVAPATTIALLKALNNGVTITNFPATQPVSGTVTVIGPTPDGSAASTNPVLIAGTTDGTATGLVAVPKVTAGGILSVDGSASTQPVSAASLPLPSGAATSAAQTTMATNQTAVQGPIPGGAATATKFNVDGCENRTTPPTLTDTQQAPCQMGTRGSIKVEIAAANSTATPNFLTLGADAASNTSTGMTVYARPSVYNGSTWDRQPGTTAGTFVLPGGFSFSHITTATTTTAKSGAGSVHTICVNSLGTVASTVTVYDNTAGSGTVIAVINSLALLGCQTYDVAFATGLTLVTTGTVAPDVTASYR